jgi:hypothetical protein
MKRAVTIELVFHFQGGQIEGCDLSGHEEIEGHPFPCGTACGHRLHGWPESSANCRWIGGAKRDRTADLLVANEALSQLSYSPTMAGTTSISLKHFAD